MDIIGQKDNTDFFVGTPSNTNSQVITTEQLQPVTPIILPTQTEASDPSGFIRGLQQGTKSLADYYKETEPVKSEASMVNDAILRRILSDSPDYNQRPFDQREAEQQAGLPDLRKQLADINVQLQTGVAELTKSDLASNNKVASFEGKGEDAGFVTRQQAETARQYQYQRAAKAAELGLLQARASALQGNIDSAQKYINDSINLKYEAQEKQYENWFRQAQALEPYLDKEEKRRLEAVKMKREDELRAIEDRKQKEKDIQSVILEAAKNGADQNTLNLIGKATSYREAIAFAGESLKNKKDGIIGDSTMGYYDISSGTPKLVIPGLGRADKWITLSDGSGNQYAVNTETGEKIGAGDGLQTVDANGQPIIQLTDKETKVIDDTTEAKSLKSLSGLKDALKRYKDLVSSEGFALRGSGKALLDSAYADLQVKWKEAANLGALTGPDLKLLSDAVKPVTGLAAFSNKPLYGAKGIMDSLDAAIINTERIGQKQYDQLITRNPKYKYSEYVQGLGTSFDRGNPVEDSTKKIFEQFGIPLSMGPSISEMGGIAPVKAPEVLAKFPEGSKGGQCGDFVRKITSAMGVSYPRLGDSLTSKINAVKKYGSDLSQATIGSVIVTKENPTYGHVAYIIGQNEKGYIVAESNYKQSEKVSYGRVIPYSSKKIVGVINPTA